MQENNLRPHQQSPRKTENNGHRFKTEDPMTVLVEVHRLAECHLARMSGVTVYLPLLQGLLSA